MMTQSLRTSDAGVGSTERSAVRDRSLRSRVSSGHVVMVVAGLLGLLLSLSVLRRADTTVPVMVVDRDLASGTRVQSDLFHAVRIHADRPVLDNLVAPDALAGLQGRIVRAPLRAGDLLQRSNLGATTAGDARRSMSFPVDSALAVGGDLAAGDRIDVLASATDGARSGYVLTGADVVAVQSKSAGPLRSGDGQITITVAVDAAGAERLAAALHGTDLLVVRSTGAAAVSAVHWFGDAADG
jgi:Flp pilus assembly protein CpaB